MCSIVRSHDDFSGFANEDREKLSELHQLFLLETLPKYAERDKQAGFVNAVIHQLHERDQKVESYIPEELKYAIEPRDKRRAYLGMAALLDLRDQGWDSGPAGVLRQLSGG